MGREDCPPSPDVSAPRATKHAQGITNAEAVTLPRLVAHIARIEITVH